MKQLFLLSFAVVLMACGGGSKDDSTMAATNPCGNPCAVNPCGDTNPCGNPCENPCSGNAAAGAGMDVGVDWSGWASWPKVNANTFVSKGHKKPWVNVYVTDAAVYKAGGTMPKGFAAVKAIHADVDGAAGDPQALTVMAKMDAGYDEENGDWYYAVMSPDGSKVMQEGKLPACIGCHTGGDDYMFQSKVVNN